MVLNEAFYNIFSMFLYTPYDIGFHETYEKGPHIDYEVVYAEKY
jgi:hypothetical protein